MRITITTDEGEVLDVLECTPEEFWAEQDRNPHGLLSFASIGPRP